MNNTVSVLVNGQRFGGWKSVHIEMSLDQIARAFSLEVTRTFPNKSDYKILQSGGLVQVMIGDDLVCTGYITATPVKYDGKTITVNVQGKSKTVDLVDCCPPSAAVETASSEGWAGVKGKSGNEVKAPAAATMWKNTPTSKIIAALAKPYGIAVRDDAGIATKPANHTINPGETVVESINRLITKDNIILTDDENGSLVITQPGHAGDCVDALVLGQNVLSGEAKFDFSKRFSDYVVLGQHKQTDSDNAKTSASDKGSSSDKEISRYRLKVIKDKGQSSNGFCLNRADFEMRYAKAQSKRATYKVQGWRQSTGVLWTLNSKVRIVDAIQGKLNVSFVITKVVFDLNSQGMVTTLDCCDKEGISRDEKSSKTSSEKEETGTSWSGVK